MSFIRLFFRAQDEEEIAHRWASRLGKLIGPSILELRPETTLTEMLNWAVASQAQSIDFAVVFEPELRMELAEFLDDAERSTFREMVEHYAQRFRPASLSHEANFLTQSRRDAKIMEGPANSCSSLRLGVFVSLRETANWTATYPATLIRPSR